MLLKLHGKPALPEWNSQAFISPRHPASRSRTAADSFPKERSNIDYLVTSRGTTATTNQHPVSGSGNEHLMKENKVLARLLTLSQAKAGKMKEELKKAKFLLKSMSTKCVKLQSVNIERNQLIDNLRRQLSFFEDRYYTKLGASKGHSSFCEGTLSEELLQARMIQQKEEEIEADEDKMVNISMLDQSNIIDLSRVNKQSVMKRKRNNKGSIHILGKDREQFFKKPISPMRTPPLLLTASTNFIKPTPIDEESKLSRANSPDFFEFDDIDYKEAFKIEEAKAYLTQMAKELLLDINSRAKYTFSRMKHNKYIDFGMLPTPVIKVDRSVSCPSLTYSRKTRPRVQRDADVTLLLDKVGYQVSDDYSIDCDFDELKRLILKQA